MGFKWFNRFTKKNGLVKSSDLVSMKNENGDATHDFFTICVANLGGIHRQK
jgi:hypothetical protein